MIFLQFGAKMTPGKGNGRFKVTDVGIMTGIHEDRMRAE